MFTAADWEKLRQLLCALQSALLDQLVAARADLTTTTMAEIAHVTIADTIYGIDAVSEELILAWLEANWPPEWPVQLVMEGLEDRGDVCFPAGLSAAETALRLLVDPIDGTREIMWDRRSAWSLAALAPQKGDASRLSDIQVAAMTELPTTRAWRADQFSGVRGNTLVAEFFHLTTRERATAHPMPYAGDSLQHGFAGLAMPFPGAKRTVAAIEEAFYTALEAEDLHTLPIFADQYLCTGGQMADLMTGRLRFFGDLRPIVFSHQERAQTLCCHPYDVCVALLAELVGVVIESPDGQPLDAPMDTTSPVAWVGYANPTLAARARPALQQALAEVLRPGESS